MFSPQTKLSSQLTNINAKSMIKLNNEKNQGILTNLAKLMLKVKTGEKLSTSRPEGLASSMIVRSSNGENKGAEADQDHKLRRSNVVKGYEGYQAIQTASENVLRSNSALKNKPGYFNVLQALKIGQERELSDHDDGEVKIVKSKEKLNTSIVSINKKSNSKLPPVKPLGKKPANNLYKLRGLDMVTEMSASKLMYCLEGVFRRLGLDPFIVDF